MKRFYLRVIFNTLPAAHALQQVYVEARSMPVALRRGMQEIRKRPELKRKRIKVASIEISEVAREGKL